MSILEQKPQNCKKTLFRKISENPPKFQLLAIYFFWLIAMMSRKVYVTLLGYGQALGARKMGKTRYIRFCIRFWAKMVKLPIFCNFERKKKLFTLKITHFPLRNPLVTVTTCPGRSYRKI